jgi:hypothetical protein
MTIHCNGPTLLATKPESVGGRMCGEVYMGMLKRHPHRIALLGGFVIGSADLVFARTYWNSKGVTMMDILHSIARGVYGKESYALGIKSAVVGALAHYFIATCVVAAYLLLAALMTTLVRRPIASGAIFGVLLYFFMNLVVLPLSAAGLPSFTDRTWVAWNIAVHIAFGLICAACAHIRQSTISQSKVYLRRPP